MEKRGSGAPRATLELLGVADVSKVPSPAAGFNSNVRHRGAEFHLQTEDSGVRNPRIVTHLFADGGRIVRTLRFEYREHLGRSDLADFVRTQMRSQHKAMYVALRMGELDASIEAACGPLSAPPRRVSSAQFTMPPELSSLVASIPARAAAASNGSAQEAPSAVHVLPVPEIVNRRPSTRLPPALDGEKRRPSTQPPAGTAVRPVQMRPPARSAALPIPPLVSVSEPSRGELGSRAGDELDSKRK